MEKMPSMKLLALGWATIVVLQYIVLLIEALRDWFGVIRDVLHQHL